MTESEFLWLLIGGIVVAFIVKNRVSRDDDGRVEDDSVTRELVLEELESFAPVRDPKLKYGYTEKSVQKQLDVFLKERFAHVTREFAIGGVRGTAIDFSVGHEAVDRVIG